MESNIVLTFASEFDSSPPQNQPPSIINEAMRFSVGIEEIDEEHQVLFKCLDAINSSLHSQYSYSTAFQALETLTEYARTHFRIEECLMRLMGYPGLKTHQAQHQVFVAEMTVLREQLLKHDAAPAVAKFLTDWLLNHIKISDTEYARFFLERGFGVKTLSAPIALPNRGDAAALAGMD